VLNLKGSGNMELTLIVSLLALLVVGLTAVIEILFYRRKIRMEAPQPKLEECKLCPKGWAWCIEDCDHREEGCDSCPVPLSPIKRNHVNFKEVEQ